MLAIVAPGQGAQHAGFLQSWLTMPGFEAQLQANSTQLGLDLIELGTAASDTTIRATDVAQPLLCCAGLAVAAQLGIPALIASHPQQVVLAGHSVGEFVAAALAEVLTPLAALSLVQVRAQAMAAAADAQATSMVAVLGGDETEVLTKLAEVGLSPANRNGAGQIVAAGSTENIERLLANPPHRSHLRRLSVAGAFHTEYMSPAVPTLATAAAKCTPTDPLTLLLSNRDGQLITSGQEYLDRLVTQVRTPVRWDRCLDTMADLQVSGLLELTPAGTLTAITKRQLGIDVFAVNTPDDLNGAKEFLYHHLETR